jgi:hypothetical protein
MLIAVINESNTVTMTEARAMTRAVGYQLRHHVAPAWGLATPHTMTIEELADAPEDAFLIALLDHADAANALGYHDLTPDGRPYGRVFVVTSQENGASVSSVLSHEAAEILGDPLINNWSSDDDSVLWANELVDPVEENIYEVTTYGEKVQVSNFVLPEWFTSTPTPGAQFDYLGNLKQPFSMTSGGYVIKMQGGKVSQEYGAGHPAWKRESKLHPASRTARRLNAMNGVRDTPILPEVG